MYFKVTVTGDDAHPAVTVEAATKEEALKRVKEMLKVAKGSVPVRAKVSVITNPAEQPYLFFSDALYRRLGGERYLESNTPRFFKVALYGGWYDFVVVEAFNDTDAYETTLEVVPDAFGSPETPEGVTEVIEEVLDPLAEPWPVYSRTCYEFQTEEMAKRRRLRR